MQRRLLIATAPAAVFAALLGCAATASAGPRYTIPREEIEETLAQRFPRRFGANHEVRRSKENRFELRTGCAAQAPRN